MTDDIEQFLETLVLTTGRGHRRADTPEEVKNKIHARIGVIKRLGDDKSPEAKRIRKAARQAIKLGLKKFPYLVKVILSEVAQ